MTDLEPRLLTAVHEAGHAVVAHDLGLTVKSITMHTDVDGETDIDGPDDEPWTEEAYVRVAVAGFAAVGVLLGAEAEELSRSSDFHDLDGSDLLVAIGRAGKAGVPEADLDEYLHRIDGEVRAQLARPEVGGSVQALAEELWGDADYLSGDNVRAVISRVESEWAAVQSLPGGAAPPG